jgi:hypothetical protein
MPESYVILWVPLYIMLEALLTAKKAAAPAGLPQDQPLIGFNYDRNASTGTTAITSSHSASQLIVPGVAVPGYNKVLSANAQSNTFTNSSAMNVGTGDFTMEMRVLLKGTSGYVHLWWSTSTNSTGIRMEDSGFGDKLAFFINANTHVFYAGGKTKADMQVWRHLVLMRKNGNVSFYWDGVRIGIAADRGADFSQQVLPAADALSAFTASGIGYAGYGAGYCVAEWAFYNRAKFDGMTSFTPPSGYIAP